jgi:DNA (cytosine-5)-methyltransferase 1
MELTYGSVCSGIEAATQAWHPLGWKPAWFSQFDPEHNYKNGPDFPSRVLAHHHPEVMNLGNMLDIEPMIRAGMIEAPDALVGGTPCQAFSVAGLRDSLNDTRGQLTLHYVTLADTIDQIRIANGKEPSIIVWENVPGVLNTPDDAFGCFIGALAGEPDKLHPPTDKAGRQLRWPDAGCVVGAKRTIAWRVLDAQYFGLAQRRRRVFVVASAREDFHPAQVLFEFDGVFRDSPPSRETGQKTTGNAAPSTYECGGIGSYLSGDVSSPLLKSGADLGNGCEALVADIAPTLDASFGDKWGLDNQHINSGGVCLSPVLSMCLNAGAMGRRDAETETLIPMHGGFPDEISVREVSPTITQNYGKQCDSSDSALGPNVVIALAGNTIGRKVHSGGNGTGFCETGECVTLTKTDVHAVAVSGNISHALTGEGHDASEDGTGRGTPVVAFSAGNSSNAHGIGYSEEHTPPLRASSSGTNMTPTVVYPINTQMALRGADTSNTSREGVGLGGEGDPAFTLQAAHQHAVAFHIDAQPDQMNFSTETTATLTKSQHARVCQTMQVRRLTPRECERLQGFGGDFTLIPGDSPISKVKREKLDMDYVKYLHRGGRLSFEECMNAAADGPRYKALGNSMAVPVMHWIGQRIEWALSEPWPELTPEHSDPLLDLLAFFDTPDSITECPTT